MTTPCHAEQALQYLGIGVWQSAGERPSAFCVRAMTIDADGAPTAYAPEDSGLPELDDLANAGSDDSRWALITDAAGDPVIQGPGDPAPGCGVSTTALADPTKDFAEPT